MTARDRRTIVWGAGVVLVTLLARLVPWGVRSLAGLRAQALERVAAVDRGRAALAAAPALRDSLGHLLGAVVGLAPKLVDGRSAAEASASLSALVSLAASRHALKVVRLDPLPDSTTGPFGRVAVHAEFEGDISGLTRLLKALESGDPLLDVASLSVDAPDPVPHPGTPEVLRIELSVTGFFLPRAPS